MAVLPLPILLGSPTRYQPPMYQPATLAIAKLWSDIEVHSAPENLKKYLNHR